MLKDRIEQTAVSERSMWPFPIHEVRTSHDHGVKVPRHGAMCLSNRGFDADLNCLKKRTHSLAGALAVLSEKPVRKNVLA